MSLKFCLLVPPDIEEKVFELMALFDKRVPATEWNADMTEINTDIAAVDTRLQAIDTKLSTIRQTLFYVRRKLLEKGV